MLLRDSVPFRVHWPKNADLRINNVRFNTGRRNVAHALGPNGRDEAVSVGSTATAGARTGTTMLLLPPLPYSISDHAQRAPSIQASRARRGLAGSVLFKQQHHSRRLACHGPFARSWLHH